MKLSTRTRYAIRALVDLAVNSNGFPIFIKDIAARQAVSVKYLEALFYQLKQSGLIRSIRGARGGYLLDKKPEEITLWDLVTYLETSSELIECISDKGICERKMMCPSIDIYKEISERWKQILSSYTLESFINNYYLKRESALIYCI
ncbi:RrF2 family transcriptional regulator [Thermoproteota archaeon]